MYALGLLVMFVFAMLARLIAVRDRLRHRVARRLLSMLDPIALGERLPLEPAVDPWAGEDLALYGVFGRSDPTPTLPLPVITAAVVAAAPRA